MFKKGQPQQAFVDIADIRSGMANINMGNQNIGMQNQGPQYSDKNDFNDENLPEWKKKLTNIENGTQNNQNNGTDDIPDWKKKLRNE
jgi:hypothetical protein